MHEIPLLYDFVIILASATVAVILADRVKVPPIVAFLLTGVLIGPGGLALVHQSEDLQLVAEFGVVALLFIIGLELSLDRLREMGRAFLLGGTAQGLLTGIAIIGVALVLGLDLRLAVFLAFIAIPSSTALVLRLLDQRQELEAPHGKTATGILIFQDFLVVLLLVLTPVLAGGVGTSTRDLLIRFGTSALVVLAIFVVSRLIVPPFLHALGRTRANEVFVIGALAVCLSMAYLTASVHLSLALGAFLAGLLFSDSPYSHHVVAEILPFRDAFISIFFVSIGTLLSLPFVVENAGPVLGIALALALIKVTAGAIAALTLKLPLSVALVTGVTIAQVGEFSFVIANEGVRTGLIGIGEYQTFLAASLITMIATPLALTLARRYEASLPSGKLEVADKKQRSSHLIIAGFGYTGERLADVVRRSHIPVVVIELDGARVSDATDSGYSVIYGDASRATILEEADLETAVAIVLSISDPLAEERIVTRVREMSPKVRIIVRTRHVEQIDTLRKLGADTVISEEFETAIEVFTRVLEYLHVPRNVIQAERRVLRAEGYEAIREGTSQGLAAQLLETLTAGAIEIHRIGADDRAANLTVGEVGIEDDVQIIALVRDGIPSSSPDRDFVLLPGDSLILHGAHASVNHAIRLLEEK